jgi:hypothetical protein
MAATEHYVTLFDGGFLPFGLCLHESLSHHAGDFHLWIVCMDEPAETALRRLALPNVSLIPVAEIETPQLLGVKAGRTRGEYCWTLTPFVPAAVFARCETAARVTYLDADLFFFASPLALFEELDSSGAHVLITEHAYDPDYDHSATSGRFCVQFMTFARSPQAGKVLDRWQRQCIEWCFDRVEPGRFGDQKYLDDWPSRFGGVVHVLRHVNSTVGPWNARMFHRQQGRLSAVFYHFHGFRLLGPHWALLFSRFEVGQGARAYYRAYVATMRDALRRLRVHGIPLRTRALPEDLRSVRAVAREWSQGRAAFGWI